MLAELAGCELGPDRTFELQGNKINGERMDMNRIDEVVEVDTTEIWEVRNTDGEFHNFHVHDMQFQVLDIDGQPPAAEFAVWKDTVLLKPGSKARPAMRFSDYTDPEHPYMLHFHRLRHEDQGTMAQHDASATWSELAFHGSMYNSIRCRAENRTCECRHRRQRAGRDAAASVCAGD